MKLVVETGTFADALTAAARVSSEKSTTLCGVMVAYRDSTADSGLMVQSSNGEVTFRRNVKPEEISFGDNDKRRWYFPAKLVSKLMSKFPLDADSYLEIEETADRIVHMQCGRISVTLNLLDADLFPHIPTYSADDLGEVDGLAVRLKQVSFAADKAGIKSGLHVTGDYIVTCSTGLLARAACSVPVTQPVTLPIAMLGPILKNTDVIHIGERDNRFILQTDIDTQVITTIMMDPYPKIEAFQELRTKYLDRRIMFSKQAMKDALGRMLALANEDEMPRVRMYFREDRVDMQMYVQGVGEVTDYIDAECDMPSEVRYCMTPKYVLDVINVWPTSDVNVEFHGDANNRPFALEHKGLFTMWMGFPEPNPKGDK